MGDKSNASGHRVEVVRLEQGVEINGVTVRELEMREPTVGDQLDAMDLGRNDAAHEVALIANLCAIAFDDVRNMTLADYRRAQKVLAGFSG